jgi:hypothetical protein
VVERVGKVAYRIKLPAALTVHDVFHVSLLTPYVGTGDAQPLPQVFEDADPVVPKEILRHRERTRGTQVVHYYLIGWSNSDPGHCTWQPEQYVPRDLVQRYWLRQQQKMYARQPSSTTHGVTPRSARAWAGRLRPRTAQEGLPSEGGGGD